MINAMNPVTIDDQGYLCPTWQQMGEVTVDLAEKVRESGEHFDRVVALAKGGLSWNRQLQDLLSIKHTSSIQVKFYTGINSTNKRPIVIQSLPVSIQDESILIFDDVADTGESLILAKDYIEAHGPSKVMTATLFEKPWSNIKPDFSGFDTEEWVIFPHDATENIKLLKAKWKMTDEGQFIDRLHQIGIEKSIINFYLASESQG